MSRSILLEASINNAAQKFSNGEWISEYKEPFLVEPGDVIQLKNAFLDSVKDNPDDIVLDEPVDLSFTFFYYDEDYSITSKVNKSLDPWGSGHEGKFSTFKTYIAYDIKSEGTEYGSLNKLNFWWKDRFDKKWYNKTAKFQYTDHNGVLQHFSFKCDPKTLLNDGDPHAPDYWVINPTVPSIKKTTFKLTNPSTLAGISFAAAGFENDSGGDATLLTGHHVVTIPKGSYTYSNIAHFITDELDNRVSAEGTSNKLSSGTDFLRRSDDSKHTVMFLRASVDPNAIPDYDAYYYGKKDGADLEKIGYWYGSTQNALVYNEERQVFAFEYIHTPMFDVNNNQVITDYVNKDGKWETIKRQTGIGFLDLQPSSFWVDKLGFDMEQIIVKPTKSPTSDKIMIPLSEIKLKTTSNYVPLQSLIPKGARNTIDMKTGAQTISTATNMLLANNLNSDDQGSGYYLLEISNLKQEYIYAGRVNLNINAILSKQYNSSSLEVSFSDSGISYYHNSQAKTLTALHIRILDPDSKEVATDLGKNNSIILELIKPLKPVQKEITHK